MKFESHNKHRWFKALILSIFVLSSHSIVANEDGASTVISPIRLNKDMISGLGLETAPWDDESRLAKWSHLFTGKELSVSVFESTPKKVGGGTGHSKNRVRNYPYDQFVLVLSGKSVLTDEAGNSQTFVSGDFFVVHRGFSGTWEEYGVYRELIVIQEEAVRTRKLEIERVE